MKYPKAEKVKNWNEAEDLFKNPDGTWKKELEAWDQLHTLASNPLLRDHRSHLKRIIFYLDVAKRHPTGSVSEKAWKMIFSVLFSANERLHWLNQKPAWDVVSDIYNAILSNDSVVRILGMEPFRGIFKNFLRIIYTESSRLIHDQEPEPYFSFVTTHKEEMKSDLTTLVKVLIRCKYFSEIEGWEVYEAIEPLKEYVFGHKDYTKEELMSALGSNLHEPTVVIVNLEQELEKDTMRTLN